MICPYCLGTDFEAGLFDEPILLHDRLVLFRNVPALRCTQCDELLFGPESGRLKDRALADRPSGVMTIDCYDLAQTIGASELDAALVTARERGADACATERECGRDGSVTGERRDRDS